MAVYRPNCSGEGTIGRRDRGDTVAVDDPAAGRLSRTRHLA